MWNALANLKFLIPTSPLLGNIRLKVRTNNCESFFDDGKANFKNVKGDGVEGGKR
jgi:hypothetical protein